MHPEISIHRDIISIIPKNFILVYFMTDIENIAFKSGVIGGVFSALIIGTIRYVTGLAEISNIFDFVSAAFSGAIIGGVVSSGMIGDRSISLVKLSELSVQERRIKGCIGAFFGLFPGLILGILIQSFFSAFVSGAIVLGLVIGSSAGAVVGALPEVDWLNKFRVK
jgi:hypothetical protein